jgi:DNA-binding LytR/AlgR family response regulator
MAAWWLENAAQPPDLLFLDIHLADDLSFRLFEQAEVGAPVVFTTAYDQYALRAFKVNSVDYLLKPIDREALAAALQKFRNRHQPPPPDWRQLAALISSREPAYQQRFMVSRGERLLSIPTSEVAWFEGEDRYVYLMTRDGKRYIVDYKLSELESLLPPQAFFRLNRSFLARFEAIQDMVHLSKSRVKVTLAPAAGREIIVSSEKNQAFKTWLNQ